MSYRLKEIRHRLEASIKTNRWENLATIEQQDVGWLLSQLDRAEKALEFYSNPTTWECTTVESTFDGCGLSDLEATKRFGEGPVQVGGRRARDFFAQLHSPGSEAEDK